MLDNKKQIKAFQLLDSTALETPAPITLCASISTEAKSRSEAVNGLLLDGATYPDSVSEYAGKLPVFAEQLVQASNASQALSSSISPYCTPSQLLQLKIGWECYVKGYEIKPAPDFWLVKGMGDTDTPQTLLSAISALDVSDLTTAMIAINEKLSAATSSALAGDAEDTSTTTTAPVTVEFTDSEIQALKKAVTAVSTALVTVTAATGIVNTLAGNINSSTALAVSAMDSAVSITLTNNLKDDSVMGSAIALLMPAGVIDALNT